MKSLLYPAYLLSWFVIILLLAEYVTYKQLWGVEFSMDGLTYVLDHKRLYKIKPDGREDIDQNGYRFVPGENPRLAGEGNRVWLAGDSFVFAANIPVDQTAAAQLDHLLGTDTRVVNTGVPGYGPDQTLITLKDSDITNSEPIVLAVFPANDFNDLAHNRIFDITENETLILQDKNILQRLLPSIWLSTLVTDLSREKWFSDLTHHYFNDVYDLKLMTQPSSEQSLNKIRLMKAVLTEFRIFANTLNSQLLVVIIPSIQQFTNPGYFQSNGIPHEDMFYLEDMTELLADEAGLPTINLYKYFQRQDSPSTLYLADDGHLSLRGNTLLASIISDKLKTYESPHN